MITCVSDGTYRTRRRRSHQPHLRCSSSRPDMTKATRGIPRPSWRRDLVRPWCSLILRGPCPRGKLIAVSSILWQLHLRPSRALRASVRRIGFATTPKIGETEVAFALRRLCECTLCRAWRWVVERLASNSGRSQAWPGGFGCCQNLGWPGTWGFDQLGPAGASPKRSLANCSVNNPLQHACLALWKTQEPCLKKGKHCTR